MIRFADPALCPDCRTPIARGMTTCDSCGLPLLGDLALRLFTTLQQADTLLTALRGTAAATTTSTPTPAATTTSTPTPTGTTTSAPAPAAATSEPAHQRPPNRPRPGAPDRIGASSVPKILLTLGAICLLVAALVFFAVAWSFLGVGGRTVVLVALTVVAAVLARRLYGRGLRSATEAVALVAYGLLALDLSGAQHAGWFGGLPQAGFLVLIGTVMVLTGAAGSLAGRRLISGQVVAALGAGTATVGIVGGDWRSPAFGLVVAVVFAGAVTAAAYRVGLPVTTIGAALVTAAGWLGLVGIGLSDIASEHVSWHDLWVGLPVWPLLAAAALIALLGLVRSLPLPARIGAGAVAHLLLAIAVLAPTRYLSPTDATLVALGVLLLTAALTLGTPGLWGLVNGLTQLAAGAGVLVVSALLVGRSIQRLEGASDLSWAGGAGDTLPIGGRSYPDRLAAWLLPLAVLCLAVAGWTLVRAARTAFPQLRSQVQVSLGETPALAFLAATVVLTFALYAVPIWTVLAVLLLVAGGFVLRWWTLTREATRPRPAPLAAAIGFGAVALLLASHAVLLFGPALVVLTAAALLVQLRSRDDDLAAGAGVTTSLGLGAQVWIWGNAGDLPANWRAVLAAGVLGLLVLAAPCLPDRFWRAHPVDARAGMEIGAALAYVPIAICAVLLAPAGTRPEWAAVHLTLAGVVVTATALLRRDRRAAGWVGGGLLAAASWARLWDVGVRAPEAYTLPSASVLLVLGILKLRRDPRAGSQAALGPGIGLALVPSLLWVLADPTGLRTLLLGLATLVVVLVGVWRRLAAPVLIAGTVGAVLVLRLAGPFVSGAIPRWSLIGLAGVLLVSVGATWERRMLEARAAATYLRGLR